MENNGFSVLVVDDSPLIVDRLINLLRELPCIQSYFTAFDFDTALMVLNHHEVNVAILDINMPGKNGIELLSYIREKSPQVLNIMLTNQVDAYYRSLCNKLGADYFLDKTHDFEKVPELVNSCYSIHRH